MRSVQQMLSHDPLSSEINIKVKDTYLVTYPIKIYWSGDSLGGCFH